MRRGHYARPEVPVTETVHHPHWDSRNVEAARWRWRQPAVREASRGLCGTRLRAQPMLHEQHALFNIVLGGKGGGGVEESEIVKNIAG